LPGALILVARQGRIAFLETCGRRDLDRGESVERDTIFRIYPMTTSGA